MREGVTFTFHYERDSHFKIILRLIIILLKITRKVNKKEIEALIKDSLKSIFECWITYRSLKNQFGHH